MLTSRHYARIPDAGYMVYCNYPAYDFALKRGAGGATKATWRVGGDPRGTCEVRVIPIDANMPPATVTLTIKAGTVRVPIEGKITPEGDAAFAVPGGREVEIGIQSAAKAATKRGVVIGAPAVADA